LFSFFLILLAARIPDARDSEEERMGSTKFDLKDGVYVISIENQGPFLASACD
jgi:hypothetical protein